MNDISKNNMLTGQFQFDYALITKPNPFFLFLLSCFPALNSRVKDKAEEMNIRCMCETWTPRRSGRGGSILKRPGRSEIRSAQLHWRNTIPSVVDRLRVLRIYTNVDMVLRGGLNLHVQFPKILTVNAGLKVEISQFHCMSHRYLSSCVRNWLVLFEFGQS